MKKILMALVVCTVLGLMNIALAGYELPEGDGKDIINNKCKTCHGLGFIIEGNYTKSQWDKILKDMKGMGLQLSEDEQKKALTYLATYLGKPDKPGSEAKAETEKTEKSAPVVKMSPGQMAYNTHCAYCHRPQGNGIDGAFPPLAGNKAITHDKAYNIMVMLYGLKGEIEVEGKAFSNTMPSWSHIEDKKIAEIINYYLTSWDNNKILVQGVTPVSEADVAEQRKSAKTTQDVMSYRKKIIK